MFDIDMYDSGNSSFAENKSGLASMIIKSLNACPIDTRLMLEKNIILSGGTS